MMHTLSVTSIAITLLSGLAHALPAMEAARDGIIYGCQFKGKIQGVYVDRYISVGHDQTVGGVVLDCGTTSQPRLDNIFSKCTVNGVEPLDLSVLNPTTIICPIHV